MPQFILTINLGNEGMQTNYHLGSKLMGLGNQITYGPRCEMNPEGKTDIRDINGNVVGHYGVV